MGSKDQKNINVIQNRKWQLSALGLLCGFLKRPRVPVHQFEQSTKDAPDVFEDVATHPARSDLSCTCGSASQDGLKNIGQKFLRCCYQKFLSVATRKFWNKNNIYIYIEEYNIYSKSLSRQESNECKILFGNNYLEPNNVCDSTV